MRTRHLPGPATAMLAEPSHDVIKSAEDVVAVENRVRKSKLDRELEEAEDWFREREDREADRQTAQEAAERERREREDAEDRRREWADCWLERAL